MEQISEIATALRNNPSVTIRLYGRDSAMFLQENGKEAYEKRIKEIEQEIMNCKDLKGIAECLVEDKLLVPVQGNLEEVVESITVLSYECQEFIDLSEWLVEIGAHYPKDSPDAENHTHLELTDIYKRIVHGKRDRIKTTGYSFLCHDAHWCKTQMERIKAQLADLDVKDILLHLDKKVNDQERFGPDGQDMEMEWNGTVEQSLIMTVVTEGDPIEFRIAK